MNNSKINNNLNEIKSEKIKRTEIQSEMKNKLGVEIYESWLKKIIFVEEFSNYLLLSVPTRFIRDWITSRYLDQILTAVKNHRKEIVRIEFKIDEKINEKNDNNSNFKSLEKKRKCIIYKRLISSI